MALLLETLRIEEGKALHLFYHEARMRKSAKALFGTSTSFRLATYLLPPDKRSLWRCRILYDTSIRHITYHPYVPKTFRRFKLVESDIDYTYKYADRSALDDLKATHPAYDDIIIVKQGLVTDTTVANLAFFDGTRWLTPETPLLEGTVRARMLEEKRIMPARITADELSRFSRVALMNAMIGFKPLKDVAIEP